MSRFIDYNFRKYDCRLLLYILLLNGIGIFVIASATFAHSFRDPQVLRQLMGSFAGLAICLAASLYDYRRLCRQSGLLYLLSILLLLGVKVYGTASHGAVRWITLPIVGQVQPTEFVKLALILFYANYFHRMKEEINLPHVVGLALLYYLIPAVLILLQPNLSTTIIVTVIVAAIVFASPISLRWILGAVASVIPFAVGFIVLFRAGLYDRIPFLRGYQAERILTFLNPSENQQSFYQQRNSIMAIASGMFSGKGLFNTSIYSVKNGNFLVEQDNDFIFAVIGEELGFRGAAFIIIIFLLIIIECLIIAARAKNLSGRLIAVGMAAWIGFQTYINIAVATGLFPNTGITLPFFSRGVSSLLSVYAGFGVVLNIALQREERG